MHLALRMAAGTVGGKLALGLAVEDRLGEDAARRIAGAEEEDVEDESHDLFLDVQQPTGVAASKSGLQISGWPRQQSLTRKVSNCRAPSVSAA